MFTKTILGVAAAAFIAAGSLGASTSTASATGIYVGGNGFYFGYGDGYPNYGKKVCKPILKKVKWRDRWGYWHSTVKVVDYKCWWKHKKPHWDDDNGYNDHNDHNDYNDYNGGYAPY